MSPASLSASLRMTLRFGRRRFAAIHPQTRFQTLANRESTKIDRLRDSQRQSSPDLPEDVNRPAILLLAVRPQGCARSANASTLTALARQLRVFIDSCRRFMSCPPQSMIVFNVESASHCFRNTCSHLRQFVVTYRVALRSLDEIVEQRLALCAPTASGQRFPRQRALLSGAAISRAGRVWAADKEIVADESGHVGGE